MTSINVGDFGTGTSSAAAATVNHTEGTITTESLTQATNVAYTFTLTNNCIMPGSIVLASLMPATAGAFVLQKAVITAGQAVLTFLNVATATASGAGTLNFLVI